MNRRSKGFSLFEMLLVLAISSALIIMFLNITIRKADETRQTTTVMQFQQVLNAALLYYTQMGYFPNCSTLPGNPWPNLIGPSGLLSSYLPNMNNNPYGNSYVGRCDPNTGALHVITKVSKGTDAAIIAGKLAGAYTTGGYSGSPPMSACSTTAGCLFIEAYVMVPGQNLNNARSVNFAGIYHNGACVPAPNCPTGMTPQIFVAPASVNGVNDQPTNCANGNLDNPQCAVNVYPLSSFTAFARGKDASGAPADNDPTINSGPLDCAMTITPQVEMCNNPNSVTGSSTLGSTPSNYPTLPKGKYWRVCLGVITEKGQAYPKMTESYNSGTQTASGYQHGVLLGSVLAITRCAPGSPSPTEPAGSDFTVWSPNNNSWSP